jgi:RNA polymerase sigma factor for flagellar operon FliA
MSVAAQYLEVQQGSANELVRAHAALVKRIAWHLKGRLPASVELGDLVQAGMMGLLEAAKNYAPGRAANFETFAGIRIRGAMLDELRKTDWTPRSVYRRLRDAMEAMREIEAETGREASESAVAERMGISVGEYSQIMADASRSRVLSLDEGNGDEDGPGFEVSDEEAGTPASRHEEEGRRAALAQAIEGLPEREKLLMSLYYDEELNLKEIGAVLGVTESRVCQLHGQALTRLRARLRDWRARD